MASPATLDLTIRQGDGYTAELHFVDANDDPVSVAGATWLAQIRRRAEHTSELVGAFDLDLIDAAAGVVRLSLPAAETALLPRQAAWDLERTVPGGSPATLVEGTILSPRDISRGTLPGAGAGGGDIVTVTLEPTVTVVLAGTIGPPGPTYGQIDGGAAAENFGGIIPLDAGGAP